MLLDVEALKIEHDRDAVLANAARDAGQLGLGAGGIDHHMAEFIGQRDEIALGIDNALLYPGRGLFEQATQQVGFAGAGIALHQKARGEQLFEIERRGRSTRRRAHVDCYLHSFSSGQSRLSQAGRLTAVPRCLARMLGECRGSKGRFTVAGQD